MKRKEFDREVNSAVRSEYESMDEMDRKFIDRGFAELKDNIQAVNPRQQFSEAMYLELLLRLRKHAQLVNLRKRVVR